MKRAIFCENEKVQLLNAQNHDRQLIYDMAFEDDTVWKSMLQMKENFPSELILDEEDCFFGNEKGKSKYYLILVKGQIVGTVSHTFHEGAKIESMELDIWLRNSKFTGQGIGSSALKLLIDTLNEEYKITTFIIRPWMKNKRAIKAYEKVGFRVCSEFDPTVYYVKYLEEFGQGDFLDETWNMVLELKK